MTIHFEGQAQQLGQALARLGLSLDPIQQEKLLIYAQEFRKWNKVHNLSAIDQEEAFVRLHLMDCLALVPHLEGLVKEGLLPEAPYIADLGAGGGLPGIPLAIALPSWHFVLIEAVKKKAAFLQHIKGKLNLSNVQIAGQRIELFTQTHPHVADGTISRAFTELKNVVSYSSGLLKQEGLIMAMKSQKAELELSEIPKGWDLLMNISLSVPDLEARRCLLILKSMRK